jgi:hypothetical protein
LQGEIEGNKLPKHSAQLALQIFIWSLERDVCLTGGLQLLVGAGESLPGEIGGEITTELSECTF